jgi:DNA polymerase
MNLIRDYETKSQLNLAKVGIHVYAADPSTEILCMAYCIDDEPIKIWHPGDPIPREFKEAEHAVAHNAAFEMAIERSIMGPRYKFPIIPVDRNICTMTEALAMALPGKLELCAKALGLEERKDKDGRRAMLQTTKPRRARKGEDEDDVHWYDDDVRLELVDQYCMQDVAIEREVFKSIRPMSADEYELWLLDQRINNNGFYIDHKLALAASKIVDDTYPLLNIELSKITEGQVQTVNQVKEMKAWLSTQRLVVEDLDKDTVELLLSQNQQPMIRRVLEIRQLGAHAAVKKLKGFLTRRAADGRVRGEFQFHAAGTGRWSSRGVQVHNLKRLPDAKDFDCDAAIKVAMQSCHKKMAKAYPNPLATVGLLMRPLIVSQDKHELWGADFSGIEARVTAWLAGEEKKLDVFRAYDAGNGFDPYIVAAAIIFKCTADKVTKEQRQVGKAAELAFGFQGGLGAFRKFSPNTENVTWKGPFGQNRERDGDKFRGVAKQVEGFSDDEIEVIKNAWRAAHPKINQSWCALNDAFWDAMHHSSIQYSVNRRVTLEYDRDSFRIPVLWLTLPSGRQLSYPDIKIRKASPVEKDFGRGRGVYFMDNTQGRWRGVRVYGGLITENVVQAVARDLLADALKRLDEAGFKIVTHTHDEVVCEERKGSNRFEQFNDIMNAVPSWAAGLPLMAKGWRDVRYVK